MPDSKVRGPLACGDCWCARAHRVSAMLMDIEVRKLAPRSVDSLLIAVTDRSTAFQDLNFVDHLHLRISQARGLVLSLVPKAPTAGSVVRFRMGTLGVFILLFLRLSIGVAARYRKLNLR